MTQSQLITGLKKGDDRAIKVWFNVFYGELMSVALVKIKSKKDAKDVVQETFINCLKQLPLFEQRSSLKTWMISILRHEIADFYRKKYAKKAIKTLPLSQVLLGEAYFFSADQAADAHQMTRIHQISDTHQVAQQVKQQVKQVLSKMMPAKKELLLMKYVDKKRVKQIAQELGRTLKSVESDLFRARKIFRQLYANLD